MIKYLLLFFVVVCVSSCKMTEKVVMRREVPHLTEAKLLKNIEQHELEYESLYAKKLEVCLERDGKKDHLRAVLKIKRDSFIWMSLTAPLGIEIARVLLTPDSIKFIDSYNKKYFFTDYRYFYDKFDIRIGFDCFQKLLTNVYFNLEGCGRNDGKENKFKFETGDNDYVLLNVHRKALNRKLRKFFKKRKKNKDYTLILQKIHIDPVLFRPSEISLEDLEDDMGMTTEYGDFKEFGGKIFPERIDFKVSLEDMKIKLGLRFQRLEFDVNVIPNFRISSRYKPLPVDK